MTTTLDMTATTSVETMFAIAADALASARTEQEAAEAIEELLESWYDRWPETAVTSPHHPIAVELIRLLGVGRRPRWWHRRHHCPGPLGRLLRRARAGRAW